MIKYREHKLYGNAATITLTLTRLLIIYWLLIIHCDLGCTRINTIFQADQYDLSNWSLRYLVRFNTIFQVDQCDLSNRSLRYLIKQQTPLYVGRYSTTCVSAMSTRILTFLAQITCDLHAVKRNARYLVLVACTVCAWILSTYVHCLCMYV
jgi:hypothetical protein